MLLVVIGLTNTFAWQYIRITIGYLRLFLSLPVSRCSRTYWVANSNYRTSQLHGAAGLRGGCSRDYVEEMVR